MLKASGDLDVFLDRGAADIGDEARFTEVELRQYLLHHLLDARVLQAYRIEHSSRCLEHTVRRVAKARLPCRSLEHDCACIAVAEAFDAGVLLAKPDASG